MLKKEVFTRSRKKLTQISNLKAGWDYDNAPIISWAALKNADQFLIYMEKNYPDVRCGIVKALSLNNQTSHHTIYSGVNNRVKYSGVQIGYHMYYNAKTSIEIIFTEHRTYYLKKTWSVDTTDPAKRPAPKIDIKGEKDMHQLTALIAKLYNQAVDEQDHCSVCGIGLSIKDGGQIGKCEGC